RRPPATLGTPPQARETHTRPGPPGFSSPDRAGRYAGQPAKTLQGRPRTPSRANQYPSNQASRPQESRLTSRKGLKRKLEGVLQNFRGGGAGDRPRRAGRGLRVFGGSAGDLFRGVAGARNRSGAAGETGSGHTGLAG